MSFLRHQEIYQVSIGSFGNDLFNERARPFDHALTHRLDESPIGYSWRVALQQSPLPLHQSAATLRQSRGELQVSVRCFVDPHLNSCLTSGVHPRIVHSSLQRDSAATLSNPPTGRLGIVHSSLHRAAKALPLSGLAKVHFSDFRNVAWLTLARMNDSQLRRLRD